MRILKALLLASTLIACGDGGTEEEAYDTFQDCFDDHHLVESFDAVDSVKICCIDHPIAGTAPNIVCGETAADCEVFVDTELDDMTDITTPDIQTACSEYIVERDL